MEKYKVLLNTIGKMYPKKRFTFDEHGIKFEKQFYIDELLEIFDRFNEACDGKETSEEARIGIEFGQGDAGDGRRQGEGQFDDAVQEALARELIAYQDPGQDKAEDAVHQRRQDGTGNAGDEGVADTAVGDELGIVIGRQL